MIALAGAFILKFAKVGILLALGAGAAVMKAFRGRSKSDGNAV